MLSSSSSLGEMLSVCDAALSTLPERGRPTIVIASDCRSVPSESPIDVASDMDRADIPVHILNLSPSRASKLHHAQAGWSVPSMDGEFRDSVGTPTTAMTHFLTTDDDSFPGVPLHMADDSDALYEICKITGGSFLDAPLLKQASETVAGEASNSPFKSDHYFERCGQMPYNGTHYSLCRLSHRAKIWKAGKWLRLILFEPARTFLLSIQHRLRMHSGY